MHAVAPNYSLPPLSLSLCVKRIRERQRKTKGRKTRSKNDQIAIWRILQESVENNFPTFEGEDFPVAATAPVIFQPTTRRRRCFDEPRTHSDEKKSTSAWWLPLSSTPQVCNDYTLVPFRCPTSPRYDRDSNSVTSRSPSAAAGGEKCTGIHAAQYNRLCICTYIYTRMITYFRMRHAEAQCHVILLVCQVLMCPPPQWVRHSVASQCWIKRRRRRRFLN